MPFAWSRLFAKRYVRPGDVYATTRADLDAVRSGKKGMSVFAFAEYAALLKPAFDRELVVVAQRERASPEPSVFVARPDQLWRIPAWIALRETAFTDGTWSSAAEAQISLLLGYTARQRAAWIADAKQRHAAWGCATIYALLDLAQKRAVTALGKRCLPGGIAVAFDRSGNGVVRDAIARVPKGLTLARVGLGWSAFRELFGRSRKYVATVPRDAAHVNAALQSAIQFLTAGGWR